MNTRSTTQSVLTAIDHKKIENFSTSTTVMSTTKDSEPINANPLNNNDNATAAEEIKTYKKRPARPVGCKQFLHKGSFLSFLF